PPTASPERRHMHPDGQRLYGYRPATSVASYPWHTRGPSTRWAYPVRGIPPRGHVLHATTQRPCIGHRATTAWSCCVRARKTAALPFRIRRLALSTPAPVVQMPRDRPKAL